MATLETQYENYLKENPGTSITYDEWEAQIWSPTISDNFQIGPDGAFEYEDEDVSDWDVTLLDGLEEEDFIWEDSTIKTEVIDEECRWGRHGKLFLLGNKVVFDTSDDEYGPVAFDIKTLVTALKKHKELYNTKK